MVDDDIVAKIILTPAERQVMFEQIEQVKVAFDDLANQVMAGDIKQAVTSWAEVTGCYEYISNLFNAKVNKAVQALYRERMGDS